jgi:hypothetical protein
MMKAPMKYMKVLQKWAQDCSWNNVFEGDSLPPGRNETLKLASDLFAMDGLVPEVCETPLPKGGYVVHVVRYDFLEMMRSLLTNPDLARDENYLFPGGNEPWWIDAPTWEDIESNHPESYIHSNIVQGEWYVCTHHLKCKVEKQDVLLPVIFAVDKTHTDVKGNLCLEPVIFTLGIFNRATRNRASAWRPLGFIPNLSVVCSKLEPEDKVDNYHRCLDVILTSFVETQKCDGIQWNVQLQGKAYDIVFKPEVCMVLRKK